MEKFINTPELAHLIKLIKEENNGEYRLNIIRKHGSTVDIIGCADYLQGIFPFNSFTRNTILRAAYFIIFESEITRDGLDYDCSDINEFASRGIELLYPNNHFNKEEA